MRVDHIGYAVKNMKKARETMEMLGFAFGEVFEDAERNIDISFGIMDGYRVELVAPRDGGSLIDSYLQKNGSIPYHICYRSDQIEEDIQKLLANRFRISVPLASAVAFGGKRVVFLYSLSIGLIEIVEE